MHPRKIAKRKREIKKEFVDKLNAIFTENDREKIPSVKAFMRFIDRWFGWKEWFLFHPKIILMTFRDLVSREKWKQAHSLIYLAEWFYKEAKSLLIDKRNRVRGRGRVDYYLSLLYRALYEAEATSPWAEVVPDGTTKYL